MSKALIKHIGKNPSDIAKIKFYRSNPTDHKQVIIHGVRPNGTKWKIGCDWLIKDLIEDLNNSGIQTLWSCQGNALGTPVAYVVINTAKLSKRKLAWADMFIRNYWHDRFINTLVLPDGDIAYYAYTWMQLQRLEKKYLARCLDEEKERMERELKEMEQDAE